jgi:hypothetical protein
MCLFFFFNLFCQIRFARARSLFLLKLMGVIVDNSGNVVSTTPTTNIGTPGTGTLPSTVITSGSSPSSQLDPAIVGTGLSNTGTGHTGTSTPPHGNSKSNATTYIVIGGIIVLAIAVTGLFFFNKRRLESQLPSDTD